LVRDPYHIRNHFEVGDFGFRATIDDGVEPVLPLLLDATGNHPLRLVKLYKNLNE
jgi:hypothetical protein